MTNKIFVPANQPEDWKKLLAEPDKQWRKRYSARTLAYCWHEANGIPRDVENVLVQYPDFIGIEALLIIPEHKVELPGGIRPSQNDCWILARTQKDTISIAVEGKVSEPFGPTVAEWLKDITKGKKERLAYLCSQIELKGPLPQSIRYQLLHRTASAIIEAKRFHAKHAIMMVHSFSPTAEWFDDYRQFLMLFGLQAEKQKLDTTRMKSDTLLHFAWINGDKSYLER